MKTLIAFLLLASSAFAGVQSWSNIRVSQSADFTGATVTGLSVSGSNITFQVGSVAIGGTNGKLTGLILSGATITQTSGSTGTITIPVNSITSGTSTADVRFGDLAADGFYSPNSDHRLYWDNSGGRWYFERVTGGLPDTDILQLNQLVNTGTLSTFSLKVGDVGNEFSVDFNGNVIGASFAGDGSGLTGVIAAQITGTAITNGTSTSPGLVITKSGTSLLLSGTPSGLPASAISTGTMAVARLPLGTITWPFNQTLNIADDAQFHALVVGPAVITSLGAITGVPSITLSGTGPLTAFGSGLQLVSGTLSTTGGGTVTSVAGTGAASGLTLSGTGTGAVTLVLGGSVNAMASGTATSVLLLTSTANAIKLTGTTNADGSVMAGSVTHSGTNTFSSAVAISGNLDVANLAPSGTVLTIGPTGSTNYYLTTGGGNNLNIQSSGSLIIWKTLNVQNDNTYDLGSSSAKWRDLWLGRALTVTGTSTLGSAGTAFKNLRHGISGAMTLGAVTVTDTACTVNTRYFFAAHTLGTISIPGGYYASTRTSGTSFVITSSQATETSTIDWMGAEP